MATIEDQTKYVPDGALVVGTGGLWGTARRRPAGEAADAAAVDWVLADGRRVRVPAHLLRAQPDGHFTLPFGPADLPAPAAVAPVDASPPADGGVTAQVVPLVAEQLEVHKRRVETGRVRVTKQVETREELVDLPTVRDVVTVERVPIEQFVHQVPAVRHEGDVTIIPVIEEVLVVEKRLMLLEEVRLTVRRTVTHDAQTVTLRRETAHVERLTPGDSSATPDR